MNFYSLYARFDSPPVNQIPVKYLDLSSICAFKRGIFLSDLRIVMQVCNSNEYTLLIKGKTQGIITEDINKGLISRRWRRHPCLPVEVLNRSAPQIESNETCKALVSLLKK